MMDVIELNSTARQDAIPGEIADLEEKLGAAVVEGDAARMKAIEKQISTLETEARRLRLADKARLEAERLAADDAKRQEAERIERQARADIERIREIAGEVDQALDALFVTLKRMESATTGFERDHRNVGLDLREIQLSVWAGMVHERILQDAGGFSIWLRKVENTPSVWSRPVANWKLSFETLQPDRRRGPTYVPLAS